MKNITLTDREYELIQEQILHKRNDDLYFVTGFGHPWLIKFYRTLFKKFDLEWNRGLSTIQKDFFAKNPDGDTRFWSPYYDSLMEEENC